MPPIGAREEMARDTMAAIRTEGAKLMHERGYAGMGLRDLAERIGIKAASLYHHIESKQHLLYIILSEHMEGALAGVDDALEQAGRLPRKRFAAFISYHLEYHSSRPIEAAVCLSELRCLEGENWTRVVKMRDAYEAKLTRILREGVAAGAFIITDPKLATLMVLGAITGALSWIKPRGRLSAQQIAAGYCTMLLGGISS